MPTKKDRQRKLARERHERRLAREAERQARNRQLAKWVSAGAVVIVLAAVVSLTALRLTHSKASSASPGATPSVSASPSLSPSASPSPTTHPSPSANGTVQCTYVPSGQPARKVSMPARTTSIKNSYQATIKTNRGAIVIDLLNSEAPCTVNSFVSLADQKFFNNTPCPRLVTSGFFVLQCGDPTGTGTGGPGYQFGDENLAGAAYPAGTVAMANSGQPGTNGSQFFFVYQNTSALTPSYTPFGRIVGGLGVLRDVAKAGVGPPLNPAGGGHPKDKVVIESVTIKKT